MKFASSISALPLALAAIAVTSTQPADAKSKGHGLRAGLDFHRRLAKVQGISTGQDNGFNKPSDSVYQTGNSSADPAMLPRGSSSNYTLVTNAHGDSFFDKFTFYSGKDPTGGCGEYVSKSKAKDAGLISVNSKGYAVMKVEEGSGISSRKTVRISTEDTYTEGLFIIDAEHIPVGCSLWPAAWLLSSNPKPAWPSGGEIDIVEGVNEMTDNMFSLHTASGCTAPKSAVSEILGDFAMSDQTEARNCDADATDDQGCGVTSSTDGIYGSSANKKNGGVWAFLWTSSELKMYFWSRDDIPDDISNSKPDPSSWSVKPQASWGGSTCEPDSYLWNLNLVINTALCGTWPEGVWSTDNSGGQKTSCKSKTGKSSCDAYLKDDPDLSEAYWEIRKVQIYQTSRKK